MTKYNYVIIYTILILFNFSNLIRVSEPNSFFYTVTYTYIDSLNPRGKVSIFYEVRIENSKLENQKFKVRFQRPAFSKGMQKLTEAWPKRNISKLLKGIIEQNISKNCIMLASEIILDK